MGADSFDNLVIGVDADECFSRVREEVGYEHGHGGYSGTIVEKGSFNVIQRQPLPQVEAYALADKLMQNDDPRVADKWGPAGAIPVILADRKVQVGPFDYTEDEPRMARDHEARQKAFLESDLYKQAAPLVKLKSGETIESIRVSSYSSPMPRSHYGGGIGGFTSTRRRTGCNAEVTIRKAPVTREIQFTATLPNMMNGRMVDYDRVIKALEEHAASNVRLNKGEHLVAVRNLGDRPSKSKVVATAPKDKTETRFIVKPSHQHNTWERGLGSQAEARAWATKAAEADPNGVVFEIESVTRRVTGAPLVTVQKLVTERIYTAVAIVSREVADAKPEAWYFFGYASS